MIKKLYFTFFTLLSLISLNLFCAEHIIITKLIETNRILYSKFNTNLGYTKFAHKLNCINLHDNSTFNIYKDIHGRTTLDPQVFDQLEAEFNKLPFFVKSASTSNRIIKTNKK